MVHTVIQVIICISILFQNKDQYEWGGVFAMNPGEKKLTDEEYEKMVKRYQEKLVGGANN